MNGPISVTGQDKYIIVMTVGHSAAEVPLSSSGPDSGCLSALYDTDVENMNYYSQHTDMHQEHSSHISCWF